jgi:type I restriction enzyme M protein
MIRSLKSKGKAAVILPHGVLFRGGSEAEIRKNLIKKGYIKGIIGLPANLFFGTGIPACLIVIDKENADNRKAIFMIDASKGFTKENAKNRLRDQDIHKIVDTFNKQQETTKYSRIIPVTEIEEKEYNLNIPRYIDSQDEEDLQDIAAHLQGGIPDTDINALQGYWDVYETMRTDLFEPFGRAGYSQLKIEKDKIKSTIFSHPEFTAYSKNVNTVFTNWKIATVPELKNLAPGVKPKKLIHQISETLLDAFGSLRLIDNYDVYQHLMLYWSEVMQDDVYVISDDVWKAGKEVYRIIKKTKKKDGKIKESNTEGIEGMESKLLKPYLLVNKYFRVEEKEILSIEAKIENLKSSLVEKEEEQTDEEDLLENVKVKKGKSDVDTINKKSIEFRLKVIKNDKKFEDEIILIKWYLKTLDEIGTLNKDLKSAQKALEQKVWDKYKTLSDDEIKTLVVDDKWISHLENAVQNEMQRISQRLTQRIKELADRYETPLPLQLDEVTALEKKVNAHLTKMGFVWN